MSDPSRPDVGPRFRVVLTPGAYLFDNVGDIAMCRVVAERVWAAHPGAEVFIYAASQQVLAEHGLGGAVALDERPWRLWTGLMRRWVRRTGPESIMRRLPHRRPRSFLLAARALRQIVEGDQVSAWFDLLAGTDRIIICGQGAIHDGSARRCERLAELILVGEALGTPAIAVGQGIGPLADGELGDLMGTALGRLRALGVRESWGSVPTLERLGLGPASWTVTGDDAVQLTVDRPVTALGAHLGISLRRNRASSSPAETPALVSAAVGAALPGVPLELLTMMEQPPEVSDRALLDQVRPDPPSPRRVRSLAVDDALEGIETCRVLVSGTYHAAVFGQALGIPVICLAATEYYRQKMHGVLAQFGGIGGEVLDPGSPTFQADLTAALGRWWEVAPTVRDDLRASAATQAASSAAVLGAAW